MTLQRVLYEGAASAGRWLPVGVTVQSPTLRWPLPPRRVGAHVLKLGLICPAGMGSETKLSSLRPSESTAEGKLLFQTGAREWWSAQQCEGLSNALPL